MSIISNFPVGGGSGKLPEFTYLDADGNPASYTLLDDGGGNWRIKFLASGTLTLTSKAVTVDVFLVGGGAGGRNGALVDGTWKYGGGDGGGGGYTETVSSIVLQTGVAYPIVIGAGGAANGDGGSSIALGTTVPGGQGKNGGSAGGTYNLQSVGDAGSSDGGSGNGANGGVGQGTTTREFGEADGPLYAGGGGAGGGGGLGTHLYDGGAGGEGGGGHGKINAIAIDGNGKENTGGGGGGAEGQYPNSAASGCPGGSGIVILRNHREAAA